MRKNVKVSQLILSILLSMILFFNLFLPNYALALDSNESSKPILTSQVTAESKVAKKLFQQFKDNEKVTFLLKLKDQVDSKKVAFNAENTAKMQKQTAAKTELLVRSAIVSSLRNTALETQSGLLEYLEKAKQNKEVTSFQSFYIVNSIAVTGSKKVMEELSTYSEVAKILPNETRQLITPQKTMKISTNRNVNSNTVEWGVERVGAPQVWKMGIDGTGIVVASIDTGVQWDHPALKEKYRGFDANSPEQVNHSTNWFDAVNGKDAPYDDIKHGTHTVGTMVGSEPNGSNQIGVAPGAKWIAVKAFAPNGGTDVDLIEAGEWVLAPKDNEGNPHPELAPDIVNNSWGGGAGLDEWYRPMVQSWRAADIFPVFAAGNSGYYGEGTISAPANYPESFAVGATDFENALAPFSSRGPGPYEETKPNVSAPGANIRSAVPTGDYEDGWSGTSMATPHISGVIALVKQANASLSIEQIENLLMDTAIPLSNTEYPNTPNSGFGHGFVNVYNAIKSSHTGSGIIKGVVHGEGIDKTTPTFEHTSPQFIYDRENTAFNVNVQDNISINTVTISYLTENNQWKSITATKSSGDHKNATYEAIIPGSDIKKGQLSYYWKITDYNQNQTTSSTYNVEVKSAITLGYFNNLESTPEGWYSEGKNNDWEYGVSLSEPDKAYSGEKVFGTNLEGAHAFETYSYLYMPPIDLPENKNAYLQFKHWYDFNPSGIDGPDDYGAVLISTDRKNWVSLSKTEPVRDEHLNEDYSSHGWIDREVNLSAYAGKRIYISFYMQGLQTGFDYTDKSGWSIDDISLNESPLFSTQKQAPYKTEIHIKKNVNHNQENVSINQHQTKQLIPLGAQVSVLDSGYSVSTNPADGSYIMNHNAGEFTLRAEAYGFQPKDQLVSIPEDGVIESNFTLNPLGKGEVRGVVKDQETGKPIANATLSLVEDAAIFPVKTDSKGRFTISAFEGNYTLHVFNSNYVIEDIVITIKPNKETNEKIELRKYIGYTGEIGYDDGTEENSIFYPGAINDAFAVKMSLNPGVKKAWLSAGLFKINTERPTPGATKFQVTVYDSSGPNGSPGKKITGPINANARTDGEWTYVDLADKNIIVNGDFYLTYIQSEFPPPGLAVDKSSTFHERNWFLYRGVWTQNTDPYFGNLMIRAITNNSIPFPVIDKPLNNTFTNQSQTEVKGTAIPSSPVIIQNNGKDIATGTSKADGTFSIPIKLKDGSNNITAVSVTKDGKTEPSESVKVTLDQKNPTISIKDIDSVKGFDYIIHGSAKDDYLDSVYVNGQQIDVDSKGIFKHTITLVKGKNSVDIQAKDKAGNIEKKSIEIKVNKFN
ncbi:S8 family serine peptidase [Gottfriedia solisilvae]|uniref:Bacillopeptidase F n=1 Tax=Gottfriedia solisilvae TaxID=1516104 RepID=A0A8J3AME5_9BACI|nr:S8 family serine peptidase [Gottfriedia solisilvae]GGI15435.1 bacillopeptidase F [Gottfriedia solisilvae]